MVKCMPKIEMDKIDIKCLFKYLQHEAFRFDKKTKYFIQCMDVRQSFLHSPETQDTSPHR